MGKVQKREEKRKHRGEYTALRRRYSKRGKRRATSFLLDPRNSSRLRPGLQKGERECGNELKGLGGGEDGDERAPLEGKRHVQKKKKNLSRAEVGRSDVDQKEGAIWRSERRGSSEKKRVKYPIAMLLRSKGSEEGREGKGRREEAELRKEEKFWPGKRGRFSTLDDPFLERQWCATG